MPDITYVYRCDNRKCSDFRKTTESKDGPMALLASTGSTAVCYTCKFPLTLIKSKLPKRSIPGRAQITHPGSLYEGVPDWLTRGLDEDNNGKKKGA